MSFLRTEALARLKKKSGILLIDSFIDWENIRKILNKLGRSGYGPRGYDPVQLVKALVLQSWHNLSDPELEEALRVRLDFMVFSGFEGDVPDETTICRFRNRLTDLKLWEQILYLINQQLEERELKVNAAKGAIVDATIIRSRARPRKEIEVSKSEAPEVKLSSDPDARWVKKGEMSFFGYKGFVLTDTERGFIEKVFVTPANQSEITALHDILGTLCPRRLYADKGYASRANRKMLHNRGIKDAICHKASRNRPLSRWQRFFNKQVSRVRFLVEQGFGTLKRRFRFDRASYFTTEKVRSQMILKAISFNLLKASRLISQSLSASF